MRLSASSASSLNSAPSACNASPLMKMRLPRLVAELGSGLPPVVATGIAVGNTLEAVVGAMLLTRFGFQRMFDRPSDVALLALLGAGVSTMVSATVGVSSLLGGGIIAPDRGS